jgi:hypothetical protein
MLNMEVMCTVLLNLFFRVLAPHGDAAPFYRFLYRIISFFMFFKVQSPPVRRHCQEMQGGLD